jgi:hypothetical protein
MRITFRQLKSFISEAVRTAHIPSVKSYKSELARLKKIIKEGVEDAVEGAVEEKKDRPLAIVYAGEGFEGAVMLTKGTAPVITNMALSKLHSGEPCKTLEDPKIKQWVDGLIKILEEKGELEYMVVLKKPDNKFYVVDGNHRLLAYKKYNETHEKHEITTVRVWLLPSERVLVTKWTPSSGQPDPAENYAEYKTK